MTRRYVVGLVLCLVAAAMLGLPAAAAQETTTDTATNETATSDTTTNGTAANDTDDGPGLGTQLTAFLQSSSAATDDTVENGMWQAGFERANENKRAQMVTSRTGALEQRLERLRERNESLRERYENGTIPRQAYVAQQSRLAARIDALETAVNDTDEAAAVAGVEDSRIERLKENASRLSGPDVAAIVRGNGGGPPVDAPGQSEAGTDEGNTSARGRDRSAGGQPGDGGAVPADEPGPAAGDDADPRNSDATNSSANETADSDDAGNTGGGDGSAGDGGDGSAGDGGAGSAGDGGDGSAGDGGDGGSGDGSAAGGRAN
ncbi:hypothetical protein [Haloarcula sp. JP-L23]|uniref:hypothetical protein n=1 Tax=Haloarcula sp. JP-L23 TaxID=2716717 RepID=UPI00140ED32E|nr:hypothetical protein G9465_16865 [Haloarcula sp. JP-L23]